MPDNFPRIYFIGIHEDSDEGLCQNIHLNLLNFTYRIRGNGLSSILLTVKLKINITGNGIMHSMMSSFFMLLTYGQVSPMTSVLLMNNPIRQDTNITASVV